MKTDSSKIQKRDLYLVVETNQEEQTLVVCKLLHTMSNLTPTMQPHNYRFKVKQTEIFLAPNQPVETEHEARNGPYLPPLIPHKNINTPVISLKIQLNPSPHITMMNMMMNLRATMTMPVIMIMMSMKTSQMKKLMTLRVWIKAA